MIEIPRKLVKICHQRVLLHLAVALQNVEPEPLKKQPLSQQNIMHRAQKPARHPPRAGSRGVDHDRKLPEFPLFGVF